MFTYTYDIEKKSFDEKLSFAIYAYLGNHVQFSIGSENLVLHRSIKSLLHGQIRTMLGAIRRP